MNTCNNKGFMHRTIFFFIIFVPNSFSFAGFSHLHPEDKTFLCKTVTFMNTVLLAGHQQYNPAEKSFKDFWNWPINTQNPFYPFKQALLQLGERIHAANMDVYEVSALAALMFLSTGKLSPCQTLTSWTYELSLAHFFGELVATRRELALCQRL